MQKSIDTEKGIMASHLVLSIEYVVHITHRRQPNDRYRFRLLRYITMIYHRQQALFDCIFFVQAVKHNQIAGHQ